MSSQSRKAAIKRAQAAKGANWLQGLKKGRAKDKPAPGPALLASENNAIANAASSEKKKKKRGHSRGKSFADTFDFEFTGDTETSSSKVATPKSKSKSRKDVMLADMVDLETDQPGTTETNDTSTTPRGKKHRSTKSTTNTTDTETSGKMPRGKRHKTMDATNSTRTTRKRRNSKSSGGIKDQLIQDLELETSGPTDGGTGGTKGSTKGGTKQGGTRRSRNKDEFDAGVFGDDYDDDANQELLDIHDASAERDRRAKMNAAGIIVEKEKEIADVAPEHEEYDFKQQWSDGPIACFDDLSSCCMSMWCSPCRWSMNLERAGILERWVAMLVIGVPWLLFWIAYWFDGEKFDGLSGPRHLQWFLVLVISSFVYTLVGCWGRGKIRERYLIVYPDTPWHDFWYWCCFEGTCALCQESRHVDRVHGFLSIIDINGQVEDNKLRPKRLRYRNKAGCVCPVCGYQFSFKEVCNMSNLALVPCPECRFYLEGDLWMSLLQKVVIILSFGLVFGGGIIVFQQGAVALGAILALGGFLLAFVFLVAVKVKGVFHFAGLKDEEKKALELKKKRQAAIAKRKKKQEQARKRAEKLAKQQLEEGE